MRQSPIANVLQPLIDVCQSVLEFWHDLIGDFPNSWGWAIILLTFTVRLFILPLTFKGVKSMQRLQQLQPEIKKIQERYKDDRQRMNQEVMAFYQREKVNPLGSCLPLLLQLPFFISLFSLLRSESFKQDIAGNPGFFAIDDLAEKVTEPVLLGVLIVLYVGTQLAASLVTALSADPTQRRIMLALPFVFAVFIVNFPAGLILYWITTNVWTIGQQLLVKKLYPKPEPREPSDDDGDGKAPARGKPPAAEGRRGRGREGAGPGAGREARRQRRLEQAPAQPAQEEEALRPPALREERPGCLPSRSPGSGRGGIRRQPRRGQVVRHEGARAALSGRDGRLRELRGGRGGRRGRARPRARGGGPRRLAEAAEEIPDEPVERVRAIVSRTVHSLGLHATIDVEETDDEIRATVNGDDLGLLIGKHGQTIDALQHIAFRAAFRGDGDRKQVTVDAAGYRERRDAALHRMADRAAADALRFDRPVELEPMRAPERKIVHNYLSERGDVETHSEGDEPDRRLVVSPLAAFRDA